MHSYVVYGLGVHSELPLPELRAAQTEPDMVIRLGIDDSEPSATGRGEKRIQTSRFETPVGTFVVHSDGRIWVDPASGVEDRELRSFLLERVVGEVLRTRGRCLLHGSAVMIEDSGVIFSGRSGLGKSTLAACLQARGHGILADDMVVLDVDQEREPLVYPGMPQLFLLPDSIACLGNTSADSPPVRSKLDKHVYIAGHRVSQDPVPLLRIYVLAEGPRLRIEPLPPNEAFLELLRHSYGAANSLQFSDALALHHRQYVKLANRANVFRLERPWALATVQDLARWVEQQP
jgi:hypothetical protein